MVISPLFYSELSRAFSRKSLLLKLCLDELFSQLEWEWHAWPVLTRYKPKEETEQQKIERERTGDPPIIIITKPVRTAQRYGCVSFSFLDEQVVRVEAIVRTAKTPEQLIARLRKEVEVP